MDSAAEATASDAASFSVSVLAAIVCLLAGLFAIWSLAKVAYSAETAGTGAASGKVTGRVFVWRTYLSVLLVLAFVFWLIAAQDLMWTVLIAGLLPAVRLMIFGWIDHFFDEAEGYGHIHEADIADEAEVPPASDETGDVVDTAADDADYRGRYDTYRPIAKRFARFVAIVGAVLLLLFAWGTDIFTLADSATISGRVFSVAIDLVVALLIADLVWTWAKTAIDRRLADYKPPEGPQAPGPEARMATLLPLLRMMLMITLVVMVGLSALSSMGVNIAPLLAGAGVIGVAIGFGAQALVRDVVSGIFFLIDDAFRVGEYVEIGNLRGVVESMSIRSLRVRHHRGAVHTIPFGELSSLTNYSRDWVIMKMEFRVPFETDIRLVKKLVKRIGAEMAEDPLYINGFLEPLKSQGVRRMEEFNMVVGVKFMAKPGEQWVIRRDAYQKIVDAFEANGIRLAERNVKVEVISDRPLSAAEHEAVIGAAQDAVDQPVGPPGPVPDEP
jgi:small-conductance mechanosensitive channel